MLVFIQFIPVSRTNPPKNGEIIAGLEVKKLLKRACYDCHSNETKWPDYSYVAPLSWYFINEVQDGRRHLNFSTWNRLAPDKQTHMMNEIWLEVEDNDMPPSKYLWIHKEAELSASDKDLIYRWTQGLLPEY